MKAFFLSVFATLALGLPAHAAKFESSSKMTSPAAQKLARLVNSLRADKATWGDSTGARAYSFERNDQEEDINTAKQLNKAKAGLNSEETGAWSLQGKSAKAMAEHLLANYEVHDEDFEKARRSVAAQLMLALEAIKEDRRLKVFGAGHSDEDGTWQILNVLDTKNDEVLLITFGFSGT